MHHWTGVPGKGLWTYRVVAVLVDSAAAARVTAPSNKLTSLFGDTRQLPRTMGLVVSIRRYCNPVGYGGTAGFGFVLSTGT